MNPAVAHDEPDVANASAAARSRWRDAAATIIVLLSAVTLYLPTVHHPFANLDDMGYVHENAHVQDGLTWATLKWSVRTFDRNNWHPVTWLSHALDAQLFGIDPAGHHAMNIAFHAINAGLVFWVLLLATGCAGRSFMVAMLFALHPINVEAVAWIAERKTLLSTLFFLLALGAYTWYARRPSDRRFMTVAALFALGLMAKPQIITLPFVLLLWDYWPLRRTALGFSPFAFRKKDTHEIVDEPQKTHAERLVGERRTANGEQRFLLLVLEKAPLFVICIASALITMYAQRVGHPDQWRFSLAIRAGNAVVAYVRYIGKAIWPSHLAVLYLHPGTSLRMWQVAASAALLIAITALVIAGRRHRYLPVGWFWFLGTLVPTIGLIQVGRQALADRYAYESFLGLFILFCWGVSDLAARNRLAQSLLPVASIVVLVALAVATHRQLGYWEDNANLWSHTIQVTDNNWVAEDILGNVLSMRGEREEAMQHYWAAVSINPKDLASNLMIARHEQDHGLSSEAIARYKSILAETTDARVQAGIYQSMSLAYRQLGDAPDADQCLQQAARLRQVR